MLRRPALAVSALIAASFLAGPAPAQDFSGVWVHAPEGAAPIRLVLEQQATGRVSGTLTGAGTVIHLEGSIEEETLIARTQTADGVVLMEAELLQEGLELLFASPNATGGPDYERARLLEFSREGATRRVPAESADRPAEREGPESAGVNPGGDPQPTGDSPLAREWDARLRGRKLTQLSRYGDHQGGYRHHRELHLCSSGEFLYEASSSVNVDGGGAFGSRASQDAGRGRWQILARPPLAGLDLRFEDGRHWQVRLEHQGDATHVDGERVYVTPGERCQ